MRNTLLLLLIMNVSCFINSMELGDLNAHWAGGRLSLQQYNSTIHPDQRDMRFMYNPTMKFLMLGNAGSNPSRLTNVLKAPLAEQQIADVLQKLWAVAKSDQAANLRLVNILDGGQIGAVGILSADNIKQVIECFNKREVVPGDAVIKVNINDKNSLDEGFSKKYLLLIGFVVAGGGVLVFVPGSMVMLNNLIASCIGGIGNAIGVCGAFIGVGGALIPFAVPLAVLAAIFRGSRS